DQLVGDIHRLPFNYLSDGVAHCHVSLSAALSAFFILTVVTVTLSILLVLSVSRSKRLLRIVGRSFERLFHPNTGYVRIVNSFGDIGEQSRAFALSPVSQRHWFTMEHRTNLSTFCQSTPIPRRQRSNNAPASASSEGVVEHEQPNFGDCSTIVVSDDTGEETDLIIISSSSNSAIGEDEKAKNEMNANELQSVVMESIDSFVPATPESSPSTSALNSRGLAPTAQEAINYDRIEFTQFRDSSYMSIIEEDGDGLIKKMPTPGPSGQPRRFKESLIEEFQFETPASTSFHYVESSSDSLTEEVPDAPVSDAIAPASVPKDDNLSYLKKKEQLEKDLLNLQTAIRISEHLPDRGLRLRQKIENTKAELNAISAKIADAQIEPIDLTKEPSEQKVHVKPTTKAIPVVEPRSTIALPTMGLPKTRAEAEHFANLLTGKMAEKRLCELRTVTYQTLTSIHRAMQSCPSENEETAPPSGLMSTLMLHQRQALTWLLWREQQMPSGGILADDMGLGKTFSLLSLIVASNGLPQEKVQSRRNNLECTARENCSLLIQSTNQSEMHIFLGRDGLTPSKGTLVICPASILHQWEGEIKQRVSPGLLRVCVHHGQKRENDAWRLARYDVVITTYRIVSSALSKGKKELKKCDSPLFSILWNRIILDEAHTIKSPSTETAQACYRLEALSRWALTGTPIHNNVKDLYSLLKFLRFRPFDDYQVWKTWMEVKTDAGLSRIHSVVKSILLRRTKDQLTPSGRPLISLPAKQVVVRKLALTSVEKDVYGKMFAASRLYVENFLGNGFDVEGERHFGRLPQATRNVWGNTRAPTTQGSGNIQIIVMLLRLRQACCHMALVKQAVDLDALKGDSIDMDVERQFKELSLVEDYEDIGSHAVDQLFDESFQSCKVKALIDTIADVQKSAKEERPKFVVVSEWVGLLEVISHHLRKNEITFTSITGPVPPEERTKRVERFNKLSSDPQVMLLSLTAGGVGLNLVGGNHLFILDLHWNPALELQAADRIHRVGQTRPVFIHKFVCVDTIEERVLALQEKKLQLAHSVLTGVASNSMKALSLNDLRFLFDLENRPSTSAQPQPQKLSTVCRKILENAEASRLVKIKEICILHVNCRFTCAISIFVLRKRRIRESGRHCAVFLPKIR
ncbi:hypothetical protein M514_01581, partial [Trichuris suis]